MRRIPIPIVINEPREIHKEPCEHCPSMRGDDPESREIRKWYRKGAITVWDATFACAWRREKRCYGVCLKARVTEEDFAGDPIYRL